MAGSLALLRIFRASILGVLTAGRTYVQLFTKGIAEQSLERPGTAEQSWFLAFKA